MKTFTTFILCTLAIACAVETDEEIELRGYELEESGGLECSDANQVVPGDKTEHYVVIDASTLELHDGISAEVDPKTNIAYLDSFTGVQCRCNSGCEEVACHTGGDVNTMTCSGDCLGTGNDGQACGGCTWHTADVPSPSPAGTPGGLDPNPQPGDKPPGFEPPPGELDPTFGDGELPPFDVPPGELDPTK
jgi:hypothetical protein